MRPWAGGAALALLSTVLPASCTPESGSGATATETERTVPAVELPAPPDRPVDPDPDDPRVAEVELALAASDFDRARELADGILADHPEHGYARLLLGLAFHKRKLYPRARPHFEAVIRGGRSFEKFDAAWYYLGWCLLNLGELELAREALEKHLATAPGEGDTHFALGLVAVEEGRDDDALASFRRSIELNRAAVEAGNSGRVPDVAKAHARIADVLLARDETEAAVGELEMCVRLWPAHYNAWYKLYQAHVQLGNTDKADASLKKHDHWKAQVLASRAANAE